MVCTMCDIHVEAVNARTTDPGIRETRNIPALMRRTALLLMSNAYNFKELSRAWSSSFPGVPSTTLENTLSLLQQEATVPFLCRYRTHVIRPLETTQVHQLSDIWEKYTSLESLRKKIRPFVTDDETTRRRIETSYDKSELQDIYAPFQPPSKGSLEERIVKEHPGLVDAVNKLWNTGDGDFLELRPKDAVVTLLANRIASNATTIDVCIDSTARFGRLKVTQVKGSKDDKKTYRHYYDFEQPISRLRDHQVLAIRRGVKQKVLKMSFVLDGEKMEFAISRSLGHGKKGGLWKEAVHDAWSRLIRKRCTTRVWNQVCEHADERSIDVFCDNLTMALLAPPAQHDGSIILAVDPGFRAGIKCALLTRNGELLKHYQALSTVGFVDSKEAGRNQFEDLLTTARAHEDSKRDFVLVALGNGHGTQEARELLKSASAACGIPIEVVLVNEAGASVWSVTTSASSEFPKQPASAIASVSIGRRYLNPLAELVKIPPQTLGLGMYQHDVSEKRLKEKLDRTATDAVAEVGVDANACSLEILQKVPSLTAKLAEKVIKARPLQTRSDVLKIGGIGPITYQNCAAFLRVTGAERLDATLVHPESYKLAHYLLKKLNFNLDDDSTFQDVPRREERLQVWADVVAKATKKFDVSSDEVLAVADHLVVSALSPDPRTHSEGHSDSNEGRVAGCRQLPADLTNIDKLRESCPVLNVKATVRNVVDFGIFVDFGAENDALVHRSKIGSRALASFLVGEDVSVDIIKVGEDDRRVSAVITGQELSNGSKKRKRRN